MESIPAKRAMKRSVFHTMPALQAVECLKRSAWVATPAIKALYRQRHSRVHGTQVVEDAFQRQRRAESNTYNRLGRPEAAYQVLSDKEILSTVHGFKTPDVPPDTFERGAELPRSALPSSKGGVCTTLQFNDIWSHSAAPPWYSPSVESLCVPFCDLQLRDNMFREGMQDRLHQVGVWHCLLRGAELCASPQGNVLEGSRALVVRSG